MKITGRLKGIGFAVAAFFIGRAFVMNLNPKISLCFKHIV